MDVHYIRIADRTPYPPNSSRTDGNGRYRPVDGHIDRAAQHPCLRRTSGSRSNQPGVMAGNPELFDQPDGLTLNAPGHLNRIRAYDCDSHEAMRSDGQFGCRMCH
jgi:hypothetical protein